jgi:YegS/Rv2252/BmrU family lipid kinase
VFIFNPRSGGIGYKRGLIRLIDRIWGGAGRHYAILVTTRAGEGVRLAREEAERGADLVVAVGGDGTLNEVVRGTMNSAASVGLIPAGSGNGFARHFGMPLNQEQACRGLLSPRVVRCDAGLADGRIFLVTFGCGLDADISRRYAHSLVRGLPSYFYHGLRALADYRGLPTRIRVNGDTLVYNQPLLLTLANARGYGGGTIIAPQARTDDGLLDLCVLDSITLSTALKHLGDLFNGGIHKVPGYYHLQVHEAIIERSGKGAIHVDGDPYEGGREVRIGVLKGVVSLALPGPG